MLVMRDLHVRTDPYGPMTPTLYRAEPTLPATASRAGTSTPKYMDATYCISRSPSRRIAVGVVSTHADENRSTDFQARTRSSGTYRGTPRPGTRPGRSRGARTPYHCRCQQPIRFRAPRPQHLAKVQTRFLATRKLLVVPYLAGTRP